MNYEYLINIVLLIIICVIDYYTYISIKIQVKKIKVLEYDRVWLSKRYKLTNISHKYYLPLLLIVFTLFAILSLINSQNMVLYYIYVTLFLFDVIYIMFCYIYCFSNKNGLFALSYDKKIVTISSVISIDDVSTGLYNKRHTAIYLILKNGVEIKTLYDIDFYEYIENLFNLKLELII
ncbi:hypothetical protein [Spiroplasma endosymbiont of Aspidapion aeneum]|uniref:hypothetical protein n=1 Tax=Spiroplasma endosymbiont of Aspidapion aeneum TaxID=3066276 RepID=UPI00313D1DBD